MDHADIMDRCDEKAQLLGLAALTEVERVVVLVSRANFEVELGGLSAFFYNSVGNHSTETVTALEAVGAEKAASALRAAMAKFPSGSPPADRKARYPGWQEVSESLGALDTAFSQDDPDVFSRLCSFMEAHAAELQEQL